MRGEREGEGGKKEGEGVREGEQGDEGAHHELSRYKRSKLTSNNK